MDIVINNRNIIEYEEDEEYILIDMINNKIYSLDLIGSVIWKELNKGNKVEDIIDYLSKECGVPYSEINTDILEYLYSLNDKGLISFEV